jgi:hypothetical protein
MKFIFFILITTFSIGCGSIARIGYGAKKVQVENEQSIQNWLTEKGFNANNIVTVTPENYYDHLYGLPQNPLLFDRATGNFLAIGYSNGKYCPKDVDKSFSSVLPYSLLKEKPDSFLISESTTIPPGYSIKDKDKLEKKQDTLFLKFNRFSTSFRTLTGESVEKLLKTGTDYTLVIPFAIFLGKKLQVKDLKKYYYSALTNRSASIQIVFLNLDKQEWWGEEWNKKINITY